MTCMNVKVFKAYVKLIIEILFLNRGAVRRELIICRGVFPVTLGGPSSLSEGLLEGQNGPPWSTLYFDHYGILYVSERKKYAVRGRVA